MAGSDAIRLWNADRGWFASWFLARNAMVEFLPVMLPEDLERAGAATGKAAGKQG